MLFFFDGSTEALSLSRLPAFLHSLFGANGFAVGSDAYDLVRSLSLLALCAVGATPLPRKLYTRLARSKIPLANTLLPLGALLFCIIALSDAGFNPFLYFRF